MKVLFITSTRLGDAILSTGILQYLKENYPKSKVTVACGPLPASLFEGFDHVEKVIAVKKQAYHGHWFALWRQVIKTRWDIVIDLRDSAVSRFILARERYIFGPHIDKNIHKVKQAAEVMTLSEIPAPSLSFTTDQKSFADQVMSNRDKPILGVGPSANWIGKTWPVDRFIDVVNFVRKEILPDCDVAVFAAPGEEEQAHPVLNSVPDACQINMIAKGNPAEAAAVLSRCALYIGNDSGLMHAASACGVPTIGLFGPSYPHLYAPWGAHTTYIRTKETFDELIDFEGYDPKTLNHSLMLSLSVEDVTQGIRDFCRQQLQATNA